MLEATEQTTLPIYKGQDKFHHLLAAIFFTALVLLINFPLTTHLDTHVVGRSFDDAFEVLWQLTAIEKAVFETQTNPFFSQDIFYPQGWYTASGAQPSWYLLLLSPLTAVAGPVFTFNIAILATFILAGFGVYRFVLRISDRQVPGLVAGCIYIAVPALTLRLGGHLNVMIAAMFLPYAADALHGLMGMPAAPIRSWPSARAIMLAGVFLAASILGHWYFLFIAPLPLVAMALFSPSPVAWRVRVLRLALAGGVTLTVLSPFALMTWHARNVMLPTGGDYSLANVVRQGFSPDYLISPNPFHPLWREQVATLFPIGGEWDAVSLGYGALALAIVGLLASPRLQVRPFFVMGVVSFILGLGPVLRWRGQMVVLSFPGWLGRWLANLTPELGLAAGQAAIVLPGLLLYRWMPLYSSLRVWARFNIPLALAVAILAGLGAAWLLSRGRAGRLLAGLLAVVVVFEGLVVPYMDFTPVAVNNRSANAWLAAQPAGTALIEYPRGWVDKLAMYSQSLHGLSVVNGYMSFQPTFLEKVNAELGKWPAASALPVLHDWGVDYLVLSGSTASPEFADEILPATIAIDGLCLVESFPDAFGYPGLDHTYIFMITSEGESCPP